MSQRGDQLIKWGGPLVTQFAEIGVDRGDVSAQLLRAWPRAIGYLVDPWAVPPPDSTYRPEDDSRAAQTPDQFAENLAATKRAVKFAGNRAVILQMGSLAAVHSFVAWALDIVFIDADHSYEAVLADCKAWYPIVRPGGSLCGHDYLVGGKGREPVKRAVDEFAKSINKPVETGMHATWRIVK